MPVVCRCGHHYGRHLGGAGACGDCPCSRFRPAVARGRPSHITERALIYGYRNTPRREDPDATES